MSKAALPPCRSCEDRRDSFHRSLGVCAVMLVCSQLKSIRHTSSDIAVYLTAQVVSYQMVMSALI